MSGSGGSDGGGAGFDDNGGSSPPSYYSAPPSSDYTPPSYTPPSDSGVSVADNSGSGGFTNPSDSSGTALDNLVQSGGGTPPALGSDGAAPSLDNLVQNSGGLGGLTKDFGDSGGNPRAYAGVTSSGDNQLGSFNNNSTGMLLPGAVTSEFSARSEAPAGAGVGGFTAPAGVGGGANADPTSLFDPDNPLVSRDQFNNGVPLPPERPAQADAVDTPGGDKYTGPAFGSGEGGTLASSRALGMNDGVPLPPERPATGLNLDYPGSDLSANNNKGGSKSSSDDSGGILKTLGITNPLGTAIAGGGLLYSMAQGDKTGNSPNVSGLRSTIPQVQSVIDSTGKLAQQFSESARNIQAGIPGILNTADQIRAGAQPLTEQGTRLMSYVSTGILPPEYQKQVDAGSAAAKARLISNYASRGMSTDPTKNTSLSQELEGIDTQATILGGQLAQQLFTSGTQALNAANQIHQTANQTVSLANQTSATADQSQQTATSLIQTGLNGIGLDQKTYNDLIKIDQQNAAATSQAIQNFAAALGGGGSKTQSKADSLKNLLG